MKILCVSDQIDPLVYSLSMKERFKDVDMVLSAGDLPAEYLGYIVSVLNKPLYFILGNHDDYGAQKSSAFDHSALMPSSAVAYPEHGAIDLDERCARQGSLVLAGLAGSMRYNKGYNQYSEGQMWLRAILLIPRLLINRLRHGRYLDVLLTHAPPLGLGDRPDLCHRGFKAYLWLMKTFEPRYLVHGHIHLYDMNATRVSKYHKTTVINAFSHFVIDTEGPRGN